MTILIRKPINIIESKLAHIIHGLSIEGATLLRNVRIDENEAKNLKINWDGEIVFPAKTSLENNEIKRDVYRGRYTQQTIMSDNLVSIILVE